MSESFETGPALDSEPRELSNALCGFAVIDRKGDPVGTVQEINLARTCILVESGKSLLRRKSLAAVHASAVDSVNLDASTVSLAVTAADVSRAPAFEELDESCEDAIERYYRGLV